MPTQDKISWIFDTEASTSEIGFKTKRLEIPYPPQLAKGYSEHHEVLEGVTLIQDKHEFISEDRPSIISMGNLKAEFSSSQLVIQITHSGCIHIKNNSHNTDSKLTPDSDVFSKVKSFEIEQSVITEEDIFASLILISEEKLFNLLGFESAEALLNNLNLFEISDTRKLYIPPIISDKIKNCISDNLEGSMRSLYAQSMIFEYFTDLNIYIGSTTTEGFLTSVKSTDFDVDHLHSELLKVTTDIPTLTTLAKKYNASPININQLFINKYNQSIYSFLSNQGLEQARNVLLRTNIPLKILAHKIGYSHVNHFIAAFKRKFGVTPGSIRK
jgi:AraC-like DNA-binding protein